MIKAVMIDATEAIKIAETKLPDVVPVFAALHPFVDEVQQSHDGQTWLITFRAKNEEPTSDNSYGSFLPFIEKEVRVAATTGDLLSVLNPSYR